MNSNFLTAIHIMTYLAYPGNAGAPGSHVVTFVNYACNGLVTSDEISGVLHTNPVIIRRLLAQLKKAGLAISTRGKTGGYQLARPASEISLLDVFLAVEGDRVDFFALAQRDNKPCSPITDSLQQTLHPIFARSLDALKQDLSRYSIAEVLNTSLERITPNQP